MISRLNSMRYLAFLVPLGCFHHFDLQHPFDWSLDLLHSHSESQQWLRGRGSAKQVRHLTHLTSSPRRKQPGMSRDLRPFKSRGTAYYFPTPRRVCRPGRSSLVLAFPSERKDCRCRELQSKRTDSSLIASSHGFSGQRLPQRLDPKLVFATAQGWRHES